MADDELGILISEPSIAQMAGDFGDMDFLASVQAFRAVRMLSHRMNEASTGWLARHDLTPAQYNFLAVLFQHDRKAGVSSRDVGKSMHTTSGTVTSMTDTLQQSGLIERVAHPSDKRSLMLKLTRKGERRFLAAAHTHHAHAMSAMGALSDRELSALLKLLVQAGNSLSAFVAEPGADQKEAG